MECTTKLISSPFLLGMQLQYHRKCLMVLSRMGGGPDKKCPDQFPTPFLSFTIGGTFNLKLGWSIGFYSSIVESNSIFVLQFDSIRG